MTRAIVAMTVVMALAPTAWAQHSKRDAAELSAKLDAILRNAYKTRPARKPAALVEVAPKKLEAPVASARPQAPADGDSLAGVVVHAMCVAFDPQEWAVHFAPPPRAPAGLEAHLARLPSTPDEIAAHLARLPKTPEEVAAHLARLPKTPEEVAAHLRNLPKTPEEVGAHLRRLDASLQQPHHH